MDNTVCVHASKLTGFREKKRGLLLMIILNKWVTSTVLKSGSEVKNRLSKGFIHKKMDICIIIGHHLLMIMLKSLRKISEVHCLFWTLLSLIIWTKTLFKIFFF